MSGDEWKSEFARDGFVLLRGAVSPDRVARARDAISRSLARDARAGRPPRKTHGNYCPELARDARLRALLDPLRARTARLFGERTHVPGWGAAIRRLLLGAVGHAVGERAQIALRFPDAAPSGDRRFGFHLDGYPTGKNGVPRGYLFRSTLLIGVYLTQVARPDRGNFVVWPGSHRRFAQFFRELDAPGFLAQQGAEALLRKIQAFDAGDPVQLEVEPGDAVIAHHLLGHGTADNLGRETREAVYFRVLHPDDRPTDPTPLLDEARFFHGLSRRSVSDSG